MRMKWVNPGSPPMTGTHSLLVSFSWLSLWLWASSAPQISIFSFVRQGYLRAGEIKLWNSNTELSSWHLAQQMFFLSFLSPWEWRLWLHLWILAQNRVLKNCWRASSGQVLMARITQTHGLSRSRARRMNERAGERPPWQHFDERHGPRQDVCAALPGAPGAAPTSGWGCWCCQREKPAGRCLSSASPAAIPPSLAPKTGHLCQVIKRSCSLKSSGEENKDGFYGTLS